MRQYLVYYQSPQKKKSLGFWLWFRDTQNGIRNGEKVLITSQHWYGSDSANYRTVYSVNRLSDFSPVYHSETVAGKNKSYNWSANKISDADTVALNTVKNFSLDFSRLNLNWNLDIETFEMLPFAANKIFAINFYDAGFDVPKYVIYKIIGSETLTTFDNQKVDCWKLFTESDHNGTHATETFWISKKNREFLKEEDSFGGTYRYKIKLPASAVNILPRFKQ